GSSPFRISRSSPPPTPHASDNEETTTARVTTAVPPRIKTLTTTATPMEATIIAIQMVQPTIIVEMAIATILAQVAEDGPRTEARARASEEIGRVSHYIAILKEYQAMGIFRYGIIIVDLD
ncbi:unnamed protein product, partial [Rhizoctonia solani]